MRLYSAITVTDKRKKRTPCAVCGGSGQVGFFQGESRFLLTWEECPECCGTGLGSQVEGGEAREGPAGEDTRGARKKRG